MVNPDRVMLVDCWRLIILGAFRLLTWFPALAPPARPHPVVPRLGPPVRGDQPWPSMTPGPPMPALVLLQALISATHPVLFVSRVPQVGMRPLESHNCVGEAEVR